MSDWAQVSVTGHTTLSVSFDAVTVYVSWFLKLQSHPKKSPQFVFSGDKKTIGYAKYAGDNFLSKGQFHW